MEAHRDDQSPRGWFDDLPIEITRKILEKLPIDSLACCKLLSKSFRRIINDQQFAINFLPRSAKKNPFVFISYQLSFYFLNMNSADPHEFRKVNIPFHLPDIYIIGSCNGYLCLSFSSAPIRSFRDRLFPWGGSDLHDDVTFLWNPLTTHFIELPLSTKSCSSKYGFGFNPLTQEYKVVKIYRILDSLGRAKTRYMQIFTVGTDDWRTLNTPSNFIYHSALRSNNRGVCVNGSMYWPGEDDNGHLVILALDLTTEEFTEIRAPHDNNWPEKFQNLIEIRGCLAILAFQGDQLEIWVMKDSWTLQFLIGDFAEKIAWGIKMKMDGEEHPTTDEYALNPDNVICLLEDDRLLICFAEGGILCYDFKNDVFTDFKVRGLPGFSGSRHEYEAIALFGSFIRID